MSKRRKSSKKLVDAYGGPSAWRYIGNRVIQQVIKNDEEKKRLGDENEHLKRCLIHAMDERSISQCTFCGDFGRADIDDHKWELCEAQLCGVTACTNAECWNRLTWTGCECVAYCEKHVKIHNMDECDYCLRPESNSD